jgi:hypothetical protein
MNRGGFLGRPGEVGITLKPVQPRKKHIRTSEPVSDSTMSSTSPTKTDVLLIGAGIMSATLIPSLGIQLSHEHELFTEVWPWGSRVLDLRQPAGHRERVVTA